MDCRHNYSALIYSQEMHPRLLASRYTGLHALHRGYHTEWRGYLNGHIRTRTSRRLTCRVRLALIACRERLARRAMLHMCRAGWLGPEAAEAIRKAIAAGEL